MNPCGCGWAAAVTGQLWREYQPAWPQPQPQRLLLSPHDFWLPGVGWGGHRDLSSCSWILCQAQEKGRRRRNGEVGALLYGE